jgi:hypothetical protein
MADHAKCGINTMFNTGTVVGVASNIFGGGFPPKFLPDFSWGGAEGLVEHRIEQALQTISRVYARRNKTLRPAEAEMLKAVFLRTEKYRKG